MGLFQVLRSIEDLLYEIMTWLVFYPKTLARIIRHPVQMIDYSDDEQDDAVDEQYIDTLSPPVFLILSILITRAIELGAHTRIDAPKAEFAKSLLASDENLLILRCILFSIYPLIFASALLHRSGKAVDRKNLREPFFSQCYLGGFFALAVSTATVMAQFKSTTLQAASLGVTVLSMIWFVWVQAYWFREHLGITKTQSASLATTTFLKASLLNGIVTAIFFA